MEGADHQLDWKKGLTGESGGRGRGPSRTAEAIARMRANESRKPADERICYDPFADYFISREVLELATRQPEKYRAMVAQAEAALPGHVNSILARVRFIDDVVKASVGDGLEQLVILGAGYDTRAYRIEGLDRVRVFEVDHPDTQRFKKEKIREVFSALPGHVRYVPVDLARDRLGRRLDESGYDPLLKTLFVMEGILIYLPPSMVDQILAFIVSNSGMGSAIVFDYIPQSAVDGTCELEIAKNMSISVAAAGEPFTFGISEGALEKFLAERGFVKIRNATADDYKKIYFHGKNEGRLVNPLVLIAYAEVDPANRRTSP